MVNGYIWEVLATSMQTQSCVVVALLYAGDRSSELHALWLVHLPCAFHLMPACISCAFRANIRTAGLVVEPHKTKKMVLLTILTSIY